MITTAVIMAAGKGTRFGNRTADMPKGFIDYKGRSMIERSIENLISAGITRIIIGTGYHHEWYDKLAEKYPQIQTMFSKNYANTNSMETLSVCRDAIGEEDFLLLESDIIYEPKALSYLIKDNHPDIMLVTPVTKFQDQYYIAVDDDFYLEGCDTDKDKLIERFIDDPYGELVGIHKISSEFYKDMLEAYEYKIRWSEHFNNDDNPRKRGYEFYLKDVAKWHCITAKCVGPNAPLPSYPSGGLLHARPLFVLKLDNLQWYEIDDEKDLDFAQKNIKIY